MWSSTSPRSSYLHGEQPLGDPPTLADRLEIIRFSGYTEERKLQIAQKYLVPKQLKEHGMDAGTVSISEDALRNIIRNYTREAGVRDLERRVANLCRKTAKLKVRNPDGKPIRITEQRLESMLGVPEFSKDRARTTTSASPPAWPGPSMAERCWPSKSPRCRAKGS